MIHNARIHIEGQLPVVVDLRAAPGPTDVSLLCTNMRTTDGKRPTFIEHTDSWFLVPLSVVRFLEMPSDALESAAIALPASGGDLAATSLAVPAETSPETEDDFDYEPDEAFLQRIRDI